MRHNTMQCTICGSTRIVHGTAACRLPILSLGSQLALTTLGHHFVYQLRGKLIKRILDTDIERLEQLGSARLLASLSSDIRYITVAFVRLPELVQGIILTLGPSSTSAGCRPACRSFAGDA
ncbi:putative ATP-binding cassette transporter [Aidingimonas halophila]|uniref:Putative ATP-binding cassette transporter n=1 Tax=Aidingimonas halophila TaxID=574349 RepID=A0A1H2U8A2_9GAMM|nr:hypothetical protein GCM10008094_10880 [Aidingimonas halophila]SDW51839.1 putative ATP-binding cassette transporter [Aidingimonas halophila]